MKTAIVGYPRIGAHRELKFASEQYFRGACTEAELQETAKTLRLANLTQQKESGSRHFLIDDPIPAAFLAKVKLFIYTLNQIIQVRPKVIFLQA